MGDLWNSGKHRVPGQAENPTGRKEAMDGATGADRMSGYYSTAIANDSTPHADLAKRLSSGEGVLKSLMQAMLLKSSDDEDGDESEDGEEETAKSDTKSDDEDSRFPANSDAKGAARKGIAVQQMTLAKPLTISAVRSQPARVAHAERLAGSPRREGSELHERRRPTMNRAAIQKADRSLRAIVESRLDNDDFFGGIEATNLRLLHGAIQASERGLPGALERVQVSALQISYLTATNSTVGLSPHGR